MSSGCFLQPDPLVLEIETGTGTTGTVTSLLETGKQIRIHVLGRHLAVIFKSPVSLDLLRPHLHHSTGGTALVLAMVTAVVLAAIPILMATTSMTTSMTTATTVVTITTSTIEAWREAWIA